MNLSCWRALGPASLISAAIWTQRRVRARLESSPVLTPASWQQSMVDGGHAARSLALSCEPPMEVAFRTRSLRSLCGDEQVAVRQLGDELAMELRARIADLRAAASFDDIVAGQPAFLNGQDPRAVI